MDEHAERKPVVLKPTPTPMYEFYVLATDDEDFCEDLILGHVTAANAANASQEFDVQYEDRTRYRLVIPADRVTWYRMDDATKER